MCRRINGYDGAMAHVILGLLLLRPMSLYDLIRAFESGVSLFYSASSGSIKRALDGLREHGRIEVGHVGARGRKVYRVTESGRAAFHEWMTGDMASGDTETAILSRLFFLGLAAPAERRRIVSRMEALITADLARLQQVADGFDRAEVPDELAEVAAYQRVTLDYGIASHVFALEWVRSHVMDERTSSLLPRRPQ